METGEIQSVGLTFSLIEALAQEGKPMGVTQLSERVGAQKTRVFRHLRTLLELGYVRQNASTERYQLSIKLFLLCRGLSGQFQLGKLAMPILRELSTKTSLTSVLSTLQGDVLRVVEVCVPNTIVAATIPPGLELDLLKSAQGRIALAFGPASLRDRVLSSLSEQDRDFKTRIMHAIDEAHHNGWATAPDEARAGFNVLGAPLTDYAGRFAGTVGIVGSLEAIRAIPDPALILSVKNAASAVSALLGSGIPRS